MSDILLGIRNQVVSHAMASGYFDLVNEYEPKNAPGNGLNAAVWLKAIEPVAARSGLDATTVRLELSIRIYLPMLHEPQGEIDPLILAAADALMRAYTGDFQLGGEVANVDLLGDYGIGLRGDAGYLNQDNKIFRIFVITLPLVINDLWSQHG